MLTPLSTVLLTTQLAGTSPTSANLHVTRESLFPALNLPTSLLPDSELDNVANSFLPSSDGSSLVPLSFPPSAAIVGGLAGQDCLSALSGRERTVRNLMVLGGRGSGGESREWALGC